MVKMIVLMNLLEMNSKYAIYSYGYDEDNLDGRIKISLDETNGYEVLVESKDKNIGKLGTLKAVSKLTKAAKNNMLKEKMSYQS